MKSLLLVLTFLFLFGMTSKAQDIIYTTSGNKFEVKIVEINENEVKYKDLSNLEGPKYVISKSEIVLIQYGNGVYDILNPTPQSVTPKKTETVTPSSSETKPRKVEVKKPNLYYMNPNSVSINALALANGDITIIYDREVANGHVGLSFLGGYNFNSRIGILNGLIMDSRDNAKKKYDAGFGVNLMPKTTKRVQYFGGLLCKYLAYDYKEVVDTTNNQLNYRKASGYQLAIMLTNGWNYRISPNFGFKLFASIGVPVNSPQLDKKFRGTPKLYLGYCFAYRF